MYKRIALVLAVFLLVFLMANVSLLRVSGKSMEPGIKNGSYAIFVRKIFVEYLIGDVVLYKRSDMPGSEFVGRVLAGSGEEIMVSSGKLYVRRNGEVTRIEVDNTYPEKYYRASVENQWFKVNGFFVVGDNPTTVLDLQKQMLGWGDLDKSLFWVL